MRREFKAICQTPGHPGVTFETTDPALFDAHMEQVHERKLGQIWVDYEPPRRDGRFMRRRTLWDAAPGPTRPPKADPDPFTPKPFEPGADVSWQQLVDSGVPAWLDGGGKNPAYHSEHIWRTGQIWSLGAWPKSVWVIPYQPFHGEMAVCLQDKYRTLRVVDTWSSNSSELWRNLGGHPHGSAA